MTAALIILTAVALFWAGRIVLLRIVRGIVRDAAQAEDL